MRHARSADARSTLSPATLAAVLGLLWSATPTAAQQPSDTTPRRQRDTTARVLSTLRVEATKREEALQQVPIAVTVLDRQTLRDARVLGIRQLENYAPNVAINQLGQVGGTFLTIRGLESNPFIVNRTALYIDGIPFRTIDNPLLTAASQVEVLRGPQGTLYGANADAGLVLIRTEDPGFRAEHEAGLAVNGFGNGTTALVTGRTTGQLGGGVAGSLAGQYERGDAFVRNLASRVGFPGAIGNLQLVGKLRYVTTSGWRLDGVGFLTRLRAPGVYEQEFAPLDRAVYDGRYLRGNADRPVARFGLVHDAPKRTNEDEGALGVSATRETGIGTVTIALSHRIERSRNAGTDIDLTAQALTAGGARNDNRFSNLEVRLVSPGASRVGWVIGATGYTERRQQILSTLVGPGGFDDYQPAPPQVAGATDGAIFGQLQVPLPAALRLSLGTRFEAARRTRTQAAGVLALGPLGTFQFPAANAGETFRAMVPRVALDWSPTTQWHVYASASRGWLPGGFNLEALRAGVAANQSRFGAEDLWTSELGLRWRAASGLLDVSGALFGTNAANWLEYNVLVDSAGAATSTNLITNDAGLRTRGAEIEMRARPWPSLLVTAGAGVTEATYTRYRLADGRDFEGNAVKLVPRTTSNVTATWRPRGGWYLRGELAHRGRTMLNPENTAAQSALALVGAQVGYEFERATVRAFGSNLTDVRAAAGQAYTHFLFGADGTFYAPLAAPRVVGVAVDWRWQRR